MKTLKEVVDFLDSYLETDSFAKDPSANGLQVEGRKRVSRILFGVDASEALFRLAVEVKADMVISHHGLIWGSGVRSISGLIGNRIRLLMQNDISLYASHLPLDAHTKVGNNAQLAKMISLQKVTPFFEYAGTKIGVKGQLRGAKHAQDLLSHYEKLLETKGTVFGTQDKMCSKIGIISGGAGVSAIETAIEAGLDCLVIGAFEHEMWHLVQESNLAVVSLGHYATERCGLQALMDLIKKELELECHFAEINTQL